MHSVKGCLLRFGCLVMICCFAVILMAGVAEGRNGAAVAVVGYDVEPAIFFPGDEGIISITLKNTATQSSVTEVKYQPESRQGAYTQTTSVTTVSARIKCVRLIGGGDCVEWLDSQTRGISEYRNIGALGPGESVSISFPVRVKRFCKDATYFPIVFVDVEDGNDIRFPVPVRVDSSGLKLIVEDIPSEISPGEAKEIRLTIANNRPNAVSGVCIDVKSDDCIDVTPERVFIGNIGGYEQKSMNFTISAKCITQNQSHSTQSDSDVVSIMFEASYKNGDNTHKSAFEASVLLRYEMDMHLILVDAPASVKRGERARIEFDVANGMEKPVSAVSVVQMNAHARILPSECFIGDMNPGDVFSASFTVYSDTLELGENTLKFKLRFRDKATGKIYEAAPYEVRIFVEEPEEVGFSPPLYLLVIAAFASAAVVFYVIRRIRRT